MKINLKNKNTRLILLTVATFLFLSQLIFNVYVYQNYIKSGVTPSGLLMTELLNKAVEGVTKPAIVDPISNNVYLNDLKIVLPAYSTSMTGLRYSYSPSGNNLQDEILVTTDAIINQAVDKIWALNNKDFSWNASLKSVFDQVPNLQACTRGVHIFFKADTGMQNGYIDKGLTHLADGRTIYFYTEKDGCSNNDFSDLLTYLKQAKSY